MAKSLPIFHRGFFAGGFLLGGGISSGGIFIHILVLYLYINDNGFQHLLAFSIYDRGLWHFKD
jgi:hypothetical protein